MQCRGDIPGEMNKASISLFFNFLLHWHARKLSSPITNWKKLPFYPWHVERKLPLYLWHVETKLPFYPWHFEIKILFYLWMLKQSYPSFYECWNKVTLLSMNVETKLPFYLWILKKKIYSFSWHDKTKLLILFMKKITILIKL